MKEKVKDIITIVIMLLTAAFGTVNLAVNGITELIFPLWLCTVVSMPFIYFAYAFAKWHNKRHAFWHERDQRGGEPSDLSILGQKISGWFIFGLGMFLAIIPNFY